MHMAARCVLLASVVCVVALLTCGNALAPNCGRQAGGAYCPGGQCCSQWGYCGTTIGYCGPGCQSQCGGTPAGGNVGSLVSEALFNEMLKHRTDGNCPGRNLYSYSAFIAAANSFPAFAAAPDVATRKREIAAFLAQTSHETNGGSATAPDAYAWGYCFIVEKNPPEDYCVNTPQWPCVWGKKYYGRGPIQISYNYNYGPAGKAIGVDLLSNPDLVATDPVVSFKTAFWFWMTPQAPKPSCHDVISGAWTPSASDVAARRMPGFGTITNIINGGLECGHGADDSGANRIGFYRRYCDLLGVAPGDNVDCGGQKPFGSGFNAEDQHHAAI